MALILLVAHLLAQSGAGHFFTASRGCKAARASTAPAYRMPEVR
jgi:hypothetical protein